MWETSLEWYEVVFEFLQSYGLYIGLAIMFGVNKAVDTIEKKGLKFSVKNLLKYGITYSIIAPLKAGKDIKNGVKNNTNVVENIKNKLTSNKK